MFCTKCGKEVPADSKFCNFCGAPISEEKKSQPVKTNRELSLKETYQKKYSIPQVEESINSLVQKKRMVTAFFIVSLILAIATLTLGIIFVVLSVDNTVHYDIYGMKYEEPNYLYVALASLFFSLFSLFFVASIALPVVNAVLIKKKISKRKAVLKILEE